MRQPQRRIARDGALSIQDLRNAIRRHPQLPCQRSRAHSELAQFLSQMLPRMYSCQSHNRAPFSMVINNFKVLGSTGSIRPFEADTPLAVNSNAVLAFPVSLQTLKSVPRQTRQVSQRHCGLQPIKLHPGRVLDSRKSLHPPPGGKLFGPLASIAPDRCAALLKLSVTSSITTPNIPISQVRPLGSSKTWDVHQFPAGLTLRTGLGHRHQLNCQGLGDRASSFQSSAIASKSFW